MDLTFLINQFTEKKYSRNDFLIREGQICNYIFYVSKGLVKLCSKKGDREFIMNFFPENSFVTITDSFTFQQPAHFQIIALEDCNIGLLHRDKIETICQQNPMAETFFRKQMQHTAARMHLRITEILENDATQSYNQFVKNNPQLMQRISLGDLANYLGITQASLSKIRAKK